ncbi:MAG: hypothetical protein WC102_03225 [Saccharofermentanales bacterium]
MKILKGTLRVGLTLSLFLMALWVLGFMIGMVISAFGVISVKWVILALLSPMILFVAVFCGITGTLLVLAIKGRISSDIGLYRKEKL